MKFRVDSKPFAEAAASAARIVSGRVTIPILSHARIAAANGRVAITATDLDREIEISFAAEIDAPGETTVPAHKLADALRTAPKGATASFEVAEAGNVLRVGRARFTLPALPASDFPVDPAVVAFSAPFDATGKTFAADLGAVAHAISKDETRYYLNGVFFDTRGPLAFVATDGHRLMRVTSDIEAEGPGVIVPTESVKAFIQLAEDALTVRLELSKSRARLIAGDVRFVTKLIDGTFPDYARVIPADADLKQRATFASADLAAALTRAEVAQADRGHAVALRFGEFGEVKVSARNGDGAAAEDIVPCEGDAAIEIGFNGRYFGDALNALGAAKVSLRMSEPGGPALLVDPARADRCVVLMPLRV